jgi:hypothetical protein
MRFALKEGMTNATQAAPAANEAAFLSRALPAVAASFAREGNLRPTPEEIFDRLHEYNDAELEHVRGRKSEILGCVYDRVKGSK